MKRIAVGTSAVLLLCMAAGQASAQLVPIGPFTGPYTESFGTQTSPPFVQCINGRVFDNTADLCTFPGAGTLIASGWGFNCSIGPHSGGTFYGSANGATEITFDAPVGAFGGYFGSNGDANVAQGAAVTFLDASNNVIGTDTITFSGCGQWGWAGWQSPTPVKKVQISGNGYNGPFVDMDDLEYSFGNLPTGACCTGAGTCIVSTSAGCATVSGGIYRGDGSTCATANCPSGACCLIDGSCITRAAAGCATANGTYHGDGSSCGTTQCPQPPTGACCLPNLTCTITYVQACTAAGGTYHGDNSTCAAANCPTAYQEQGDAGDSLATAQAVNGSGSLPGIAGNLDQNDVDLFKISICDAANFGATTVGGANWDTMLWVFDSTGAGVVAEDDSAGTVQSTITAQFIPANGDYYLGISGYGRFATDAQQQEIWSSYVPEQRPNGPGAGNPLGGWTDTGGGGSYTIFLHGSCYLGAVSHCYANCDGSTGVGFLNINDFVCFQSAFAAGGSYANCDGSTGPGNLNINDFVCFQSAFAAGCSAP